MNFQTVLTIMYRVLGVLDSVKIRRFVIRKKLNLLGFKEFGSVLENDFWTPTSPPPPPIEFCTRPNQYLFSIIQGQVRLSARFLGRALRPQVRSELRHFLGRALRLGLGLGGFPVLHFAFLFSLCFLLLHLAFLKSYTMTDPTFLLYFHSAFLSVTNF